MLEIIIIEYFQADYISLLALIPKRNSKQYINFTEEINLNEIHELLRYNSMTLVTLSNFSNHL